MSDSDPRDNWRRQIRTWPAWNDLNPTDWRSAVWALADHVICESDEYNQLLSRLNAIMALIPDDQRVPWEGEEKRLGRLLEDAQENVHYYVTQTVAALGFALARTYPADLESFDEWLPRAVAYTGIEYPLVTGAQVGTISTSQPLPPTLTGSEALAAYERSKAAPSAMPDELMRAIDAEVDRRFGERFDELLTSLRDDLRTFMDSRGEGKASA